jgi:hypothetical protein
MPHDARFRALALSSLKVAPTLPKLTRSARSEDRALPLLTDLRFSPLVVASHRDGLDQTVHVMLRAGVRMAFVSGPMGDLVGMVTADVLLGERPVMRAMTDQIQHAELTLADVMTPLTHWEVSDMHYVRYARVGDIVATMREHGLRYLLVTEVQGGQVALRGLFSATRLEVALGQSIDADLHAHSFAELESVLAH